MVQMSKRGKRVLARRSGQRRNEFEALTNHAPTPRAESPGVGNRHLTTLGEVPILKWSDPLPERPSRILVAGAPGVTASRRSHSTSQLT